MENPDAKVRSLLKQIMGTSSTLKRRKSSPNLDVHQEENLSTLCVTLQENPFSCQKAADIIQNQLQNNTRYPEILWRILKTLETLIKNCGTHFHYAISYSSFVDCLLRVAGKKVKHPTKVFPPPKSTRKILKERVQLKVLQIFRMMVALENPEVPVYSATFHHLQKKGVVFPEDEIEWDSSFYSSYVESERDSSFYSSRSSSFSSSRSSSFTSPETPPAPISPQTVEENFLPDDVQLILMELKDAILVLESILKHKDPQEKIEEIEVATDLRNHIIERKPKLVKLIEEYADWNEKTVGSLFLLFDRVEKVLDLYKTASCEENQTRNEKAEDHQQQILQSNEKILSFGNPMEIGLDMLQKMSSGKKQHDDPFLQWLLDGIPDSNKKKKNPFLDDQNAIQPKYVFL